MQATAPKVAPTAAGNKAEAIATAGIFRENKLAGSVYLREKRCVSVREA